MDDFHVAAIITVDTAGVVVEGLRYSNTTGKRTSLVELLLHVVLTSDSTEFINSVDHVLIGDKAGLTGVAVAADIHGGADFAVIVATGTVDRASLVGDLVLRHPFKGVQGIATMATVILVLTGDENLRGNVDLGPGGVTGDLDSIGQSRRSGLSPA